MPVVPHRSMHSLLGIRAITRAAGQSAAKRVHPAKGDGVRPRKPAGGEVDVNALEGFSPWLRVRVGEHRIICRPLTPAELRGTGSSRGLYVARIIGRKQLPTAVKNL